VGTTFSTAVYIEAPPPVVFEALGNLDTAGQWLPNLVRIEKLTPPPVGVGSEWRETRKVFGRESTEHFRMSRFDRPSRLDVVVDGSKGTIGRGEIVFVHEIVPERTGTTLELSGDIRMPGIWKLFARVMSGRFKKACHQDLEALKAHLESPWAASGRP
jgi:uncharacterized protein YndB with AHSA1/START domain